MIDSPSVNQHKGKSFREVALEDPAYHLRYLSMNANPPQVIRRYANWFDNYSPTRFIAHQEHALDLAGYAGIPTIPSDPCFDEE